MTNTTPSPARDKFSAIWISYSSLSDFLACPRAYYISNIYKNPKTGRKITLMKPPLALGQVVHSILDSLSDMPADKRVGQDLAGLFEKKWGVVAGEKGGFTSDDEEKKYKARGLKMMENVQKHPGPLARKAVKMKEDVPFFWLSEADNIILCGKIDWMEYLEDSDEIHIIDFKTGLREEKSESLQLPIYYLVVKNSQSRNIAKISYWYLNKDEEPTEMLYPDEQSASDEILKIALRIKLARQLNHFKCGAGSTEGCVHCAPYEAVLKGNSKFVGVGEYNKEVYVLSDDAVSL